MTRGSAPTGADYPCESRFVLAISNNSYKGIEYLFMLLRHLQPRFWGFGVLGIRTISHRSNYNIFQTPWIDNFETVRQNPYPHIEKTNIQWQVNSNTKSQVGIRVEGVSIDNSI